MKSPVDGKMIDRMLTGVGSILEVLRVTMKGVENPMYGKLTGATMYLALSVYNGLALSNRLGRTPTVEELVEFSMKKELFESAARYTVNLVLPNYRNLEKGKAPS